MVVVVVGGGGGEVAVGEKGGVGWSAVGWGGVGWERHRCCGLRQLHGNRHLHVSVPCSEVAMPATAGTPTVAPRAFSHDGWPPVRNLVRHCCSDV